MTFQITGEVPERLGDENPLGYTSHITGMQILKPQMDFSIDPRENYVAPHSGVFRENFGFTHQGLNESISIYEVGSFRIQAPIKPHFPQKTQEKIQKLIRFPLKPSEMVNLIDEICNISADFYKIRNGKHIAVKIDGTVVESADSEIDLLLKIQGRQFNVPFFVYEVGADSSPGWST